MWAAGVRVRDPGVGAAPQGRTGVLRRIAPRVPRSPSPGGSPECPGHPSGLWTEASRPRASHGPTWLPAQPRAGASNGICGWLALGPGSWGQ